jgi:hypothetical protein
MPLSKRSGPRVMGEGLTRDAQWSKERLKLVRNTVPPQLRGILETITYASQAVPEGIAGATRLKSAPEAREKCCVKKSRSVGQEPAPTPTLPVLSPSTSKNLDGLKIGRMEKECDSRSALNYWCERGESNPHGFPRQILSLVRLPIPPLSHV